MQAAAKHLPTLFGRMAMERWITAGGAVDGRLKTMAQLRASSMIGCLW